MGRTFRPAARPSGGTSNGQKRSGAFRRATNNTESDRQKDASGGINQKLYADQQLHYIFTRFGSSLTIVKIA